MRLLLLALTLITFALPSAGPALRAQGSAPASEPTPADAAFRVPTASDTSLLWEITGKGAERSSYLFGTIHLIPQEDYFLESTVIKALNESDEVLFEIDPREMQDPSVMMGLMTKITMRGDTSLQDLLSPERYDSVADYFNASGLPMFMLQKMKPMFLSSMVGQDLTQGNPFGGGGEGGMKSYELELSEIASSADKPISGLETMDFQLSLFDSIPYSIQAEMLFRAVQDDLNNDMGGTDSQLDQMVSMYRRRAVAEMAQLITDESAGFGNFEELLVVRRNEKWVPIIQNRLTTTPSLYAVGAGHLGGERGVIALLRAAGLTVEPVY